jgi:outer membrane lipoprotein-sorting protein
MSEQRRVAKFANCNRALLAVCAIAIAFPVFAVIPPDAKEILAGVYRQDLSHDVTFRATLDSVDKDGQSHKRKFTLSRIGTPGDSKTLLRFTDPEEIRGLTLLSVTHEGSPEQQWLYTPAIHRVRPIETRERSEPFAGSDFTFEDIGERVLDDFTYTMLNDTETMEGHKTYKIEAVPVAPDRSQYRYIYVWVAQDVPCILNAEMYDQQSHEIRVMHASQIKKEAGIWGTRRVEMSSPAQHTHTTLTIDEIHFNTGLDGKQFTPEALEQGH